MYIHKPNLTTKKMTQKVLRILFTMLKNSKYASIEKRILRVIVGKTFKKRTVNSKYNEYGLMDFTSGSIVAKINEDYQSLMNGITIQKRSKLKVELMIKLLQRLSLTFYTEII